MSATLPATCGITQVPDEVLWHIAAYLSPEGVVRLAQTCRRFYTVLPRFLVMRGKDFNIRGPAYPHWAPEPYFDGPPLSGRVKRLTMSVVWKDQGWGNRKGEIYVTLHKGSGEQVAERRQPLGIAAHKEQKSVAELRDDPVVTLAQPGDFYKFTRNAGGGGGHQLIVRDFKVIAELR